MNRFPATDPVAQPEEEEFFEALRLGELRVPWCVHCDCHVWRPKSHCTTCFAPVTQWRTLAGTGEVYSYSVVHKGDGPFAEIGPYVVAWIALDGGPTILGNVEGVLGEVGVGSRVRLAAPRDSEGRRFGPVFDLAE